MQNFDLIVNVFLCFGLNLIIGKVLRASHLLRLVRSRSLKLKCSESNESGSQALNNYYLFTYWGEQNCKEGTPSSAHGEEQDN